MSFAAAAVAIVAITAGPPENVATLGDPAVSPSGEYQLVVRDTGADTLSFAVFDLRGALVFDCPDAYGSRHTLWFLWDDSQDIVWVYSGDTGTDLWLHPNEDWVRKRFVDTNMPAPQYLKRMRPKLFAP